MRIEAVTVCVNYADFLEETLPHTLSQVDDLVVVTIPEDVRTRGLCHKMGVRCLPTHSFHQWGDRFNKGRAINYGLANLRLDGWVLHIDADIVMPSRTRWMMGISCMEPHKIYGCDRVDVVGRAAWDAYKAKPDIQYVHSCRVQPPRQFGIASRLIHVGYGGYCPIGFWQAWNPGASGIDRYPETQGSAEHTDVLHAAQWDKEDRQLIPEFYVLHLMTRGEAGSGSNWSGRKSPAFTLQEAPYRCDKPMARARYASNNPNGGGAIS